MAALTEARRPGRQFEDFDAVAQCASTPKGLLIGITGPQFSGKSFSAGRLAAGIQRVVGGQIYWVDTENDRALELAPYFKFRHVPFVQPKEPQEYEEVVRYCLSKPDCGVIVLDQCTHEHIALLDMRDAYLDAKAGEDWGKREKLAAAALVRPKAQRKRFEELVAYGAIRADGQKVPMILLYRATDKSVPGKSRAQGGDGNWVHKGWTAETTSTLPYYMTARFLLPPGSDGKPNLTPDTEWEKLSIRNPQQFRDWFKPGFQLTEDIGERLALWAKGTATPQTSKSSGGQPGAAAGPSVSKGDREALLGQLGELLTKHLGTDKTAREAAVTEAFGAPRAQVVKMSFDQLTVGLAALRKTLEGLAAMRGALREPAPAAEPTVDEQLADLVEEHREREPGEDNDE